MTDSQTHLNEVLDGLKKNSSADSSARKKNSSVSGGSVGSATTQEARVQALIAEFKNDSEIAKALNIGGRQVRKLKASLKRKGLLSDSSGVVPQIGTTPHAPARTSVKGRIRAHGFVVTIPIHASSEKYARQVQRRNAKDLDGNQVMCYPKAMRIMGEEGLSFYGVDSDEAMLNAAVYWRRFMVRLENKYDVVIFKASGTDYGISCEVGDTQNGLAKKAVGERQNWLVRSVDDGKPIVKMDNSLRVFEFETAHFRTAAEDMQLWGAPLFNDYRQHGRVFRKPSEMWAAHDELVGVVMALSYLQYNQETRLQGVERQQVAQVEALRVQMQAQLELQSRLNVELQERVAAFSGGDSFALRGYTG